MKIEQVLVDSRQGKKQTNGPKSWAAVQEFASPHRKAQTLCHTHVSTRSCPLRTMQNILSHHHHSFGKKKINKIINDNYIYCLVNALVV